MNGAVFKLLKYIHYNELRMSPEVRQLTPVKFLTLNSFHEFPLKLCLQILPIKLLEDWLQQSLLWFPIVAYYLSATG
jgi:hypothetical protein